MKRIILIIISAIILSPSMAIADEGMWMVNMLEKGLMTKMKKAGLKLPANVSKNKTNRRVVKKSIFFVQIYINKS